MLEEGDEEGEDGGADEEGEGKAFELVEEKGLGGGLVETKFGFDDKGRVDGEGEAGDGGDEDEEKGENKAGNNLPLTKLAGKKVELVEATQENEGHGEQEADSRLDEAKGGGGFEVGLRLGVFLGVVDTLGPYRERGREVGKV